MNGARTELLRGSLAGAWLTLFVFAAFSLSCVGARAQTPPAPVATPAPSASASASPASSPAPIPLAEVVTQADAANSILREVDSNAASDQTADTIDEQLSAFAVETDARLATVERLLRGDPSLETLRDLEAGLQRAGETPAGWRRTLGNRAARSDADIDRLAALGQTWRLTLAAARAQQTPPEVLDRISGVIRLIERTGETVEARRNRVLALQNRVVEQQARIGEALDDVRRARGEALDRLFVRDSAPLWSAEARSQIGGRLVPESLASIETQAATLGAYAENNRERFVLHAAIFFLLVAALYWIKRRVQPWIAQEPSLARAATALNSPVASALVLSILLSNRIYPEAPRLWLAILGFVALVPTILILRRLFEPRLLPILHALVVFYAFDLLRAILASQRSMSRLLLLAEMLAGVLFLLWLARRSRATREAEDDRLRSAITLGARVAAILFAAAAFAGVFGYVSLAELLSGGALGSLYAGTILYAAVRVADGLVMFALRVRPLVLSRAVRENRPLFRRAVRRLLRWAAALFWAYITLELFSLRAPFIERARAALTAKLEVGSLELSLGNVLAFAVAIWASILVSRFVLFLLAEDVYPRFDLARGLPYAISAVLRYLILVVGFFFAVAALGFDMTRFTILAGAFSVGLGFGLQNVFNNFVSGLIVLFERPVQVGDVVQMQETTGTVARIGIRASVIRAADGSEIIVPNGKLISDPVTNLTLSNRQRSTELRVGVAHGTDAARVLEILEQVAAEHALVAADPPPLAVFVGFGQDALDFELRAWTNRADEVPRVRSDLGIAIDRAFADEGIRLPRAQRDLHLRSVDPEVGDALTATARPAARDENG